MNLENTSLTNKQIDTFLGKIKVKRENNSLDFLNKIILGIFTNIPFQNLTLINERKKPSNELIIENMLDGIGGLCNVRNGFLYILLNTLGFKVCFLTATINDIEDCHIILLVIIKEKKYLVDTGNGYPYLNAMDINNNKSYIHPYCTYRIIKQNNNLFMQHKTNERWDTVFSFSLEQKVFSSFNAMLDKQYSQKGFGPFLTGIRVNKWSKNGGTIIRDKLCLVFSGVKNEKYRIKNVSEFQKMMDKYFLQCDWDNVIDMDKIWGDFF